MDMNSIKGYGIDKIVIFLFLLINLCSCMDDDFVSSVNQTRGNLFTLKIPEMNTVDIKTRSGDTNSIKSMLAVVIRNGKAKSAYITDGFTFSENGRVSVTLTTLDVQSNEALYVFCNVDNQPLSAVTNTTELFQTVICTSGEDVMHGVREANAVDNSIELGHSLSKVGVEKELAEFPIDSLLVCNVPKTGYANGSGYNSLEVEDVKFNYGTTKFFISRQDNDVIFENSPTTFILVRLKGKGWYRMDFYNSDKNLEGNIDYKSKLLKIEPQTFYLFNIKSVKNDGYTSKEEARNNPGSNIVYSLSVDKNSSTTNGQYALLVDNNIITLYPGINNSIDISALFPDNITNVTTYSAKVYSDGNIKLLNGVVEQDSINLMKDGETLTTGNSGRTIKFSCNGVWLEDDHLEIRLGNVTKVISFKIVTANSYLMDCKDGRTIKIPYLQANLEQGTKGKAKRIEKGDVDKVEVIWADQPDCGLRLDTVESKGWFTVLPENPDFAGNVIVGAKDKTGTVLWSWHIWCMRNDAQNPSPIEFVDKMGLYDYKPEYRQEYSNFTWMDRNLGAYDLRLGKASSRGLGYCNGRKDPFNLGDDDQPSEIEMPGGGPYPNYPEAKMYCKGWVFTLRESHPELGMPGCTPFTIFDENVDGDILDYTIKYPYSMTGTKDAYSSNWRTKYDDYWLTEDGGKSGYDPCPIGWRVPYVNDHPLGPWSAFNYASRAVGDENSPDPDGQYGVSWEIGINKYAFYPYNPGRYAVDTNPLLYTDFQVYHDNRIFMSNKMVALVFADGLKTVHKGMLIRNDANGIGDAYQAGMFHWKLIEGVKAVPTRCVRDKSIK